MLSIIVYGRNDSHGFNLHKRATISLNCLAEILKDENDEIIFVDWNTPANLPSFPETISDCLTQKAKDKIKVVRVPSQIHEKLAKGNTSKPTIEPFARNVGIVRSNPKNRWILSTNTDVILLLESEFNLHHYLTNLPSGFYEGPRLSIPDGLWEQFDRNNPNEIFQKLAFYSKALDLDEIVAAGNIQRFDAPGDFQLFERNKILEIGGFEEQMMKGWGVDSNLCKRFNLYFGKTLEISESVKIYHCEHTRQLTHFTKTDEQNNPYIFYEQVADFNSKSDKSKMGLIEEDLETFTINEKIDKKINFYNKYAKFNKKRSPILTTKSGNLVTFPVNHSFPYIIDIFESVQKKDQVIYFGNHQNFFTKLNEFVVGDLKLNLFKFEVEDQLEISWWKQKLTLDGTNYLIFDFGNDISHEEDISNLTHDLTGNKYIKSNFILLSQLTRIIYFLFFNKSYYNKVLFVFLNAETYAHGIGVVLQEFINIQQVAINSRVRFGYLKKELLNLNSKILLGKVDNLSNLIKPFLQTPNLKEHLTSHEIFFQLYKDSKGLSYFNLGTMLSSEGILDLQIMFEQFENLVLEFDTPGFSGLKPEPCDLLLYPNLDTIQKLTFNGLRGEAQTVLLNKNNSDSFLIKFQINQKNVIDFDPDAMFPIRLTNLHGFNYRNKKFISAQLNKLNPIVFFREGNSFSNESAGRLVISQNSKYELNPIILNEIVKTKLTGLLIIPYLDKNKYLNLKLLINNFPVKIFHLKGIPFYFVFIPNNLLSNQINLKNISETKTNSMFESINYEDRNAQLIIRELIFVKPYIMPLVIVNYLFKGFIVKLLSLFNQRLFLRLGYFNIFVFYKIFLKLKYYLPNKIINTTNKAGLNWTDVPEKIKHIYFKLLNY